MTLALAGYLLAGIFGQVKRTHHFLLGAWEAVYHTLLSKYIESQVNSPNTLEIQEGILSSMEFLPKTDFVHSFKGY